MRIGIVYGHASGNLGDLAINYGTAELIRKVVPDAEVHVVLRNLSEDYLGAARASFEGIKHLSFSILRTKDMQKPDFLAECTELTHVVEYALEPARFIADAGLSGCDLVLYNSGEHLFAFKGRGNPIDLVWRTLPALAAKTAGMRFITLPVTVGPFEAPDVAHLLRAFFALNDAIAVRDSRSATLLAEFLNARPPPILLDPAFFISAPAPPAPDDEATLGMVMRLETWGLRAVKRMSSRAFVDHIALYKEKGFGDSLSFRFSLAAARSFLDGVSGSKVNFIIANRPADVDLTLAIAQALTEQGYGDRLRVAQPTSVSEYQEELGRVSFIVASRFHGCILGLLAGKPVMGVHFDQHGHKIPGLFDLLGVPDYCQDLSKISPESLAESVVPLFLERGRAFAKVAKPLQARQDETLAWFKGALKYRRRAIPSKEIKEFALACLNVIEATRSQTVSGVAQQAASLKAELNSARRETTHLQAKLNTIGSELDATKAELNNTKAGLAKETTRLQAELNTTKAELGTAKAELNTTRKETTRLKAKLAKEKRTAQAVRNSLSFRLGHALVRPIRRPGRIVISLAYRLLKKTPRGLRKAIARVVNKSKVLTSLKSLIEIARPSSTQQRQFRAALPESKTIGLSAKKAYVLEIVEGRINEIKRQVGTVSTDTVEPRRKDLRIAVIMDKFTYDCFKYEANLITFTPDNWQQVLSENRPDFMFVESAWQGNDSSWGSQIVNLGQRQHSQLPELVQWCKTRNIPTAFWNKEDPAHYDEFLDAARLFDYVFTTDSDCIERYKKALGHNSIFCLPFAVQPRIHNPIGSGQKIRDVAFAGSWYEGETEYRKHRKEQMANVLVPALKYDVDIFDRHYTLNNDRYRFPEQYQPYIVGELPYEEMVYAYKMYRIILNVSSVIDSPTMFPRRVLEILASGTCVLSGYCKGIDNMLGSDIAPMSSSPQETQLLLKKLLENNELRDRLAHLGLRKVMREHTYEKRLDYILNTLGLDQYAINRKKGVSIITCTNKLIYMENIFSNYDRQQYEDKELIIILNNNLLDMEEWTEEARKHHNVTVYRVDEEESLGACLNFGVDKARFEYIAKFDDDDYYALSYLEDLMLAFDYSNAHIVGKNTHYVYFERTGTLALRNPGNEHQYTQWVAGGTIVIKREVFNEVKFSPRQPGTDSQFLKDCHQKGFRIYSADKFNHVLIRTSTPDTHTWKDEERLLAVCERVTYHTDDYRITCSDQYERTTGYKNNIRIAAYADANLNIIDGSAIWTASLVEALAGLERTEVFLFLKSKEKRNLLTAPLKKLGNVKIISPNKNLIRDNLTPEAALDEIEDMDRRWNFDAIVLRGFSLCEKASLRTSLNGRLWTYLTDIPQKDEDLTDSTLQALDRIASASKYILCQTEGFCSYWEKHVPWAQGKIRLLPPMIPEFNQHRDPPTTVKRICYAGKFAPLWGILEMFEVFASVRAVHPEVELHIFGDKIHNPPELPDFQRTVISFLENTSGVVWHRGLSREDVLSYMATMDLGWAWRSPELENNTLELSTKILEYGRCGLPVILVRNNVNKKLLGPDYPLFANTYDEVVELLHRLVSAPDILAAASARTYASSEQFIMDKVSDKYIRPLFGDLLAPGALSRPSKRVSILVAGHDLKFIDRLCRKFVEHGHTVAIDNWEGHNKHNVGKSRELIKEADIIISEWCLGNAVWYSKNKRPEQKHIIRFHLQERNLGYPAKVDMQNVDAIIFVGPHIRREAITRFGWVEWADKELTVIPDYVDTQALDLPKSAEAQFNIGIVGIVPQRKRLDLAVDIIEKLRQEDARFHLYVKGKMPTEYRWMLGKAEELRYYDDQMDRIKNSALLKDAVHFDGWGDDMSEWYQKIGFILSVSDFESFHLSVAEGSASRAIPVLLKWEGAEEIYPKDWSYRTVDEIVNAILDIAKSGRFEEIAASRYAYAEQNFDIERIARLWLEIIEADHSSIDKSDTSNTLL